MLISDEIIIKEMVIQDDIYYNGYKILSYTIKHPQFTSNGPWCFLDKLNNYYKSKALIYKSVEINKLYQMAMDQFEDSIKNGFPVHEYEAFVEYKVTYNKDGIISLYFDQYEYTGGAHGSTVRYSDTWNVREQSRIMLSDIFEEGSNYREYIIRSIEDQVTKQIEEGSDQYFDKYKSLIANSFNENNFYITDEGLVIYFQQYDIAPYSSGMPTFIIGL